MEILNKILDVINDMNMYLKAFILVVLMCAVLAYAFITKEEPASEPEPTVNKEINIDGKIETKQGDATGNFNVSQ